MASDELMVRADDYVGTLGDCWRVGEVIDLVGALAAEVRELRKDRERLDFVLENYAIDIVEDIPGMPRYLEVREDIDAAMGEAKGE